MANLKISQLTADTAPTADDLVVTVNDPGGTPATRNATVTNFTKAIPAVIGDSGSGGTKGLVPAPATGDAAAGKFLKADATWTVPAGTGLTQEQVEDIVGAMIVGGTDIDATYNDGAATVTIDSTSSGGGVFAGGDFQKYRIIGVNARPNVSTTQDTFGHAVIVPYAGSASSEDDVDGPWRKLNTAATTDTTAGYTFNNAGLVQTRWLPQFSTKLKTGASITVQRIWVGFFTDDPTTADPTTHALGFRYDTASSDTNWKAYSNDNSGGGTITDTGIAVSADTCYIFAVKAVTTSSVEFYISTDNGATFSLVATHTTNLPTSSAGMDQRCDLRTLENVSKTFKHSFTYIRMR